MLLPNGGVIDDLIVYYMSETWYRMVVNAGTRDKDLAWIRRHALDYGVSVVERKELAMIAGQGPNARHKAAARLLPHTQAAVVRFEHPFAPPLASWVRAPPRHTGGRGGRTRHRGRGDEWTLFAHLESFHCVGTRAENIATNRASGHSRQVTRGAHRQAAVRAPWQANDRYQLRGFL